LRTLKADVAVESLANGGVRLRIKADTGEMLAVELSPEKAAAHRDAITEALTDGPAPAAVSPEPGADETEAKAPKGKKKLFGRKAED